MSTVGPAAPATESAGGASDTRVIAVVGLAHGVSHFFQLILAPLFPWLKEAFGLSYAELGLTMTLLFVVSSIGQSLSGFLVDRVGPLRVMLGALGLFALAALVLAASPGYAALLAGAVLVGLGNASFHPIDYSILNARVSTRRIGHAYAVHGVTGNLGWAAAPVFLVGITQLASWRTAFAAASLLALVVLVVVWRNRALLEAPVRRAAAAAAAAAQPARSGDTFAFLRLPEVWLSFAFFAAYAFALGGVQTFAPEAARLLHGVRAEWVALCLTVYMLGSAGGSLLGGFLAGDADRAERVIGLCFGVAATIAISLGLAPWPGWSIPLLFAAMGLASGVANPSRDMLIRRAAPPGATGRVYGVVYSGLDLGSSLAPAAFGLLMDAHQPKLVWLGIAAAQAALIAGAFRAGRATRVRNAAPGTA
ncbi:MAG: MFS transporter [Burkholderiales bacterium]|nr:MFS transporter [Burkholderiales bacterium]OJX03739.1 MAG: MFS transporter [Burkholderiales bacterium 70-64]